MARVGRPWPTNQAPGISGDSAPDLREFSRSGDPTSGGIQGGAVWKEHRVQGQRDCSLVPAQPLLSWVIKQGSESQCPNL